MKDGWSWSNADRARARLREDCSTCEVIAGEPCVGFSRTTGERFDYRYYVHTQRLRAAAM